MQGFGRGKGAVVVWGGHLLGLAVILHTLAVAFRMRKLLAGVFQTKYTYVQWVPVVSPL